LSYLHFTGYCGLQLSQVVPYTSPDSFDLSSIGTVGNANVSPLWQYGLWNFQAGGTKLKRYMHKNQHTQRKLLNFEFRINGELSKIGHHFSNKKI
jgi:hypothetical protein